MAQQACPTAVVAVADLRRLPLADGSVDGVWACASLVHLPLGDAQTALAELTRVAEPGAVVYVSVKGDGDTGWRDTRHGRRWFRAWGARELTAVAGDAGLDVVEVAAQGEFLDLWARRS